MMKLAVLAATATATAAAAALDVDDVRGEFYAWMGSYGKAYGHAAELEARFAAYESNRLLVAALNAEDNGATFELNHFADLTEAEFRRSVLMPPREHPRLERTRRPLPLGAPEAFDWRDAGAVTEVKDQAQFGTCWAFSTIGNVEGLWFNAGNDLVSLSVEQLVECSAEVDLSAKHADCSIFGGWPYLAMEDVIAAGGLRSDADMPYCIAEPLGTDANCLPCMPDGYSKELCGDHSDLYCFKNSTLGQGRDGLCKSDEGFTAKVSDWRAIDEDEGVIAKELVATGPLSVCLNAAKLSFYKSGIYDPKSCNPKDLDHGVLMVGYGAEDSQDYWILKNSWGKRWGEDGYFRLARGDGTCGINTAVTTAVV